MPKSRTAAFCMDAFQLKKLCWYLDSRAFFDFSRMTRHPEKIKHKAIKKIVGDVKKFILYTYPTESVSNSCRYPVQVGSGSSLICNFFVPVSSTGGIRIRKNLWLIRISILSRQVKNHARFGDPDPGDFVISSYRYPEQVAIRIRSNLYYLISVSCTGRIRIRANL